jgi:hypothetical protein
MVENRVVGSKGGLMGERLWKKRRVVDCEGTWTYTRQFRFSKFSWPIGAD